MPEEEEDHVLKQLKKTQANITVWDLLMASKNHRHIVLDAFNRSDVSTETLEELVALITSL